jgi:hypothetical protein
VLASIAVLANWRVDRLASYRRKAVLRRLSVLLAAAMLLVLLSVRGKDPRPTKKDDGYK